MMKKSLNIVITTTLLFSFTLCNAQTKNVKTEIAKIHGNCGMCERSIEEAGNVKKEATVDWNKDTKIATLSYDSLKTSSEEILKRIALVGYDSDHFFAPDDTYSKLPKCCQYDRAERVRSTPDKVTKKTPAMTHSAATPEVEKAINSDETIAVAEEKNQLTQVFNAYFSIKDGLVKSNASSASVNAKSLLEAIDNVEMEKLPMDVHSAWMKVIASLKKDAEGIENSKNIAAQRNHFMKLSENMHSLVLLEKMDKPVYFQHCPMANDGKGANWLSKENAIKNPYYGAKMLSCGSTVETIK